MALFYFIVKAGRHQYPDRDGEEFSNLEGAKAYAQTVARELMRNREYKTAHWQIQVCDDYLQPCYECLFADVDHRPVLYGEDLHRFIVRVARTTAAMNDAMQNIELEMHTLRQTMRLLDNATAGLSRASGRC